MSNSKRLHIAIGAALLWAAMPGYGQEAPPPVGGLQDAFPARQSYSPYAGRNFPTSVFWGDTHVHTGASMDAGAFGARLTPEDAFRFASGEEVTASNGMRIKLARPLDFIVVADHSDNMGFFPKLFAGDPAFLADPTGKRWYELIQKGGQEAVSVAMEVIDRFSKGTFPPALASTPGTPTYRSAWEYTFTREGIDLRERDPVRQVAVVRNREDLTAGLVLVGLQHVPQVLRVVAAHGPHGRIRLDLTCLVAAVAKDDDAVQIVATRVRGPFVTDESREPARFVMRFGRPITGAYAETRAKWEPLYEATQIKGDGEAHSYLSPDDEFADYETWDKFNLNMSVPKEQNMLQYEYARTALQIGLQQEAKLGTNP